LLTAAGFRHGFSLRTGGLSPAPFHTLNLARNLGDAPEAVRENHQRLAVHVGYASECLYEVSQVHGSTVESVDPEIAPAMFRAREADALWTGVPELAVGVRVADCVPILVAHPKTGAVCAIHAGWRGVVAGVVSRALSVLAEQAEAAPRELLAAVGPHIGPDAFQVGQEVAEALLESVPDVPGVVLARAPRPHVDLGRAVVAQLTRAGLASANVDRVPGCTFSEPERFFSFRRDAQASGRHLAVIVAGC
jgi:YfiH family protein